VANTVIEALDRVDPLRLHVDGGTAQRLRGHTGIEHSLGET
jgi:hypothetical protein